MPDENARRIAELNDIFRTTLIEGHVILTPAVEESPHKSEIIEAVERYKFNGTDGNNPYGENDFGVVIVQGEKYFFKIDYYDLSFEHHSPDATNPKMTKRVLTIMRADEY